MTLEQDNLEEIIVCEGSDVKKLSTYATYDLNTANLDQFNVILIK